MNDPIPNKRRRRNTSGSISLERGRSDDFFLRSEDILAPLRSEDVFLGGGLDAQTSGDIVKDILLPDPAATAAAAVAGEISKVLDREGTIGKLRAKMERNGTGDELEHSVPLRFRTDNSQECSVRLLSLESKPPSPSSLLKNARISSEDWIGDFEGESVDLDLDPSLFDAACRDAPLHYLLKNARIFSRDWIWDFEGESVDLGPMDPSLFDNDAHRDAKAEQLTAPPPPLNIPLVSHLEYLSMKNPTNASSSTSVAKTNASPSAPAATKKTKNTRRKPSRKRRFDETSIGVVEPNEGDVLSGKGGFTNKHPGNIRFRQKAFELRPWYEASSKREKQEIADLLVDFVQNKGNRFLGKGKDGLWHEMIGNGPHYKASQALRERIRGRNGNLFGGCLPQQKQGTFLQDRGDEVEEEADI